MKNNDVKKLIEVARDYWGFDLSEWEARGHLQLRLRDIFTRDYTLDVFNSYRLQEILYKNGRTIKQILEDIKKINSKNYVKKN